MAHVGDAKGKELVLRPIRPSIGIRASYRKKLLALTQAMSRSYYWWLRAQYRQTPPRMAMDRTPAEELERELRKLGARWTQRFEEAAPKLAAWFAQSAGRRSDAALRKILKDAGFTVKFQITPAMRDVMQATVQENVALIRSIPTQFHTQVEGLVMRSVTEGRDLSSLTRELAKRHGITKRRAELISRDQINKASSMLRRARETEMGIKEGVWLHSHGGKQPRPTHLRNHGKRFNLIKGWPDPALKGKRIWPGTEINCRCTWRPLVQGFS
jgi:uncharacterized protein with gpF-like domain